jgi:hypothetical protein
MRMRSRMPAYSGSCELGLAGRIASGPRRQLADQNSWWITGSSQFSMVWIIFGKRGCLRLQGVSGACSG